MLLSQWLLAGGAIAVIAVFVFVSLIRDRRSDADHDFQQSTAAQIEDERRRAYETLSAAFPDPPDDPATAMFLLEEAKRHYDAIVAGGKAVENKATSVLTVAAGGTSALALFAAPRDGSLFAPSPLTGAALLLTLLAFFALLYVLRVKSRREPSIQEFLSAPIADDPRNRTAVAMSLAEDFEALSYDLVWDRRRDPLAMLIAYTALSAALFLIVVNSVMIEPGRADRPPVQAFGDQSRHPGSTPGAK